MSGFRKPEVPREQLVLWEHRLEDAVPDDHPARLIDAMLRSDAFAATFAEMERGYVLLEGQPPFHPRYLAGLYLYGMLDRIRSSRRLEAACWNRIDVIWLMEGQKPDHSTVAAFVTRHGRALRLLLKDTVTVGMKAGLIKLEHVSVDGTKIEADAGRGSVRSEEKIRSWLAHLDQNIAALEAEWRKNEQSEPGLLGDSAPWAPRGDRTPQQQMAAMQRKQEQLRKALAELDRRRAEAAPGGEPPKAIASTTDPDCRSMKDKENRSKPNYNGQIATDTTASMIVADDVNDEPADCGQLIPMVDRVEENCGKRPPIASADSGYNSGPELAALEQREIVAYLPDAGASSESVAPPTTPEEVQAAAARDEAIEAVGQGQALTVEQAAALPRDGKGCFTREAFVYDAQADAYRCPAGLSLTVLRTSQDRKKCGVIERRQYGFDARRGPPGCVEQNEGPAALSRPATPPCATCLHAAACCREPSRGRTLNRDQYEEYRERLRARMHSPEGRAIYKRRRETVEPRFGLMKHVLGLRRFMRRGLQKVRVEWSLACAAVNLGILLRHWDAVRPIL